MNNHVKKDHQVVPGKKQKKYNSLENLPSAILCNEIIACFNSATEKSTTKCEQKFSVSRCRNSKLRKSVFFTLKVCKDLV